MGRKIIDDSLGRRQSKRVHLHLQKTLRRRGPGTVAALERSLGVRSGWLRYKRYRGTMEMSHLLQILHWLDLDPGTFFSETFGERPRPFRLHSAKGKAPALVRRAVQRFVESAVVKHPPLADSELQHLEELRRSEPRETILQINICLEHADGEQLARLLGIAGSAWRHLFDLDKAQHALSSALQLAERLDNPSLTGDFLQRLSYVVADAGEHVNAWRLARRATDTYTGAADFEGIGRSFVDQGIWLFYLDRTEEAIAAQQAALRYLPLEAEENRCAALQALGLCHRQQGRLDEAATYAEQARRLERSLDPFGRARLIWLQGQIATDQERYLEAEAFLSEAAGSLMSLHPGDAALVTTELVHLQLRCGHNERAYETASSMISLVETLNRQPMISAAIIELLRCCLNGRGLTLSLVAEVKNRLSKERERAQRSRDLIR